MEDTRTLEEKRLQWDALLRSETLHMMPPTALVASIRDLAGNLLEITSKDFLHEQSNLVDHAQRELTLIGEEPQTIAGYIKAIQAFADMGHSGESSSIAIPTLNRLLSFKNLSALTDNPDEWMFVSEDKWGAKGGIWQCRRDGEAFSNDGGKTYYLLSEGGNDGHREPLHTSVHYELSVKRDDPPEEYIGKHR